MGIEEGRERRLLGRLYDHGATGSQGRGDLEEEHDGREVPRDDVANHPDRLLQRVCMERASGFEHLPMDLVGRAGIVPEQTECGRDIHKLAPGEQFSGVDAVYSRQFLDVFFHQVREFKHDPCPLLAVTEDISIFKT